MDKAVELDCAQELQGEGEKVPVESENKKQGQKEKRGSRKRKVGGRDTINVQGTSMLTRGKTRQPQDARHPHGETGSPHSLIPLISESSPTPCSISKSALVQMHLHSFLCRSEVIGWLAGLCDTEQIVVTKSFAVKAQGDTENPNMNVEMDTQDAFEVQETIQSQGLQIVGWYHSHPRFENTPSILDIENQIKQQKTSEGKFIGAIVSPFWSPSGPMPPLCLFTVEEDLEHLSTFHHHPPCAVRYSVFGDVDPQETLDSLRILAFHYLEHPQRVRLEATWAKGKTYEDKIRHNAEELVDPHLAGEICDVIKEMWREDEDRATKQRKLDKT